MLARLRIQQKLNLLVMLPLIAVIVTTVPFVIERVDNARASAATAQAARAARELGGLIQDIQQERLLALGYLATGHLDRDTLVAQIQSATDDAARLRTAPDTRAELRSAGDALSALDDVRARVLAHSADVGDTYGVYGTAVSALIDALRLSDRPGVDASGLGRLAALDALMRANEEASSVGASLVAMVADRTVAPQLATALVALDQQDQRFRRLAARPQVALVDLAEHGQAGVRLRRLADNIDAADSTPGSERADTALTVAVSYTDLRRIAQDRVIRDIAGAAQSQAAGARAAAVGVGAGGLLLFLLVVGLSTLVSRSISRPLQHLAHAAGQVADLGSAELTRVADSDEDRPATFRLSAVDIQSTDEVGELATAFNRVQSTAARLLERQMSARRNVAVMFANVARRTQTLASRQLMLIDELERAEQDPEHLERLYRLDHVATRMRRSAEALLVVSGTRDESGTDLPVPMADVIRSAVAEIEGYRGVQLGAICDVAVSVELVGDLRLLLAELLENATSFSAPGRLVEVFAELEDDCVVSIVDHGIGMSRAKLAEENRRLVDRERLDVAPTTVLGLFVVGRLARRHGLAVRLDPTPGQGVTATVTVPGRLLVRRVTLTGTGAPPPRFPEPPRQVGTRPADALAAALAQPAAGFAWFPDTKPLPRVVELPAAPVVEFVITATPEPVGSTVDPEPSGSTVDPGHGGLPRRQPGASQSPVEADPAVFAVPRAAAPSPRDVVAERDALDAFAMGTARASHETQETEARGGLTRRVPGEHLTEFGGTPRQSPPPPAETTPRRRDPIAERDELAAFLDGLARARPPEPTTGDPR